MIWNRQEERLYADKRGEIGNEKRQGGVGGGGDNDDDNDKRNMKR